MLDQQDIWTVQRILAWIEGYLAERGDEQPRVSAQWLVAEALGVSRMQLFLDLDRPLSADEREVLRGWTRRRGTGEPLQYITGYAPFRHLTVKVAPGVLIPRPETEVLVSCALAMLPAAPKPQDSYDAQVVEELGLADGVSAEGVSGPFAQADASSEKRPLLAADICTGSGCIACALASEHPLVRVIATDLSSDAVALALENAQINGLSDAVQILRCDLGEGIADEALGTFDLVVSNPPYVPSDVLAGIPQEVADYEPALALDGGADGLDVFRRLLAWACCALKPGGAFACELHETCLDEAVRLADQAGFIDVSITNDLAGKPRVLCARKKG